MEFYPLKLKSVVIWKIGRKTRKIDSKQWTTNNTMWTLIKEDRSEPFENILLDMDMDQKEALLNGFCEINQNEEDETRKATYMAKLKSLCRKKDKGLRDDTRPLFQCVTFGSFNILKVLLKHGADILQVAENQWNIIHYLIIVSRENENFEGKAVQIYKRLLSELAAEDVRKLLMMEDTDGLRPLELAVHAGCLQMFNAIVNTPGVYLVNRQRKGLKEVSWYDITEYEDGSFCNKVTRQSRSPINLLSFSERKILKSDVSTGILRKGMLKQWARKKFLCNTPFIWIWFCLRLVSIVAFYFLISVDMNILLKQYFTHSVGTGTINATNSEKIFLADNNVTSSLYVCLVSNETLNNCYYALRNLKKLIDIESIRNALNDTACQPFMGWYITTETMRNSHNSVLALWILIWYLQIYTTCSVIFDIISVFTLFCSNSIKWKQFQGKKKDIVASNTFYRVCQFTFMVFVNSIIMVYVALYFEQDSSDQKWLKIGLIFTCFFSVWSVLYFVQLMPSVGQFVNSIRRMLGIMFNFIIVYGIMLYPYPHAFMVMLKNSSGCQVPGFETLQNGIYSSFKIMLNMLDISNYQSGTKKLFL